MSSNNPFRDIADAASPAAVRSEGYGPGTAFKLPCEQASPLSRTIEAQVIPRLMLALRTASEAHITERDTYVPSDRDVREAVRLAVNADASSVLSFVGVLRARGASLQSIYLDLLAPAARKLGVMWEQDDCDFTVVTLGLGRLHQVLHALSPGQAHDEVDDACCGQPALVLPVPGEQHTFGVLMVSAFLCRLGMDVWTPCLETEEQLTDLVDQNRFALVGFSLSADRHFDRLCSSIARVRASDACAEARILVGGRFFVRHPKLVEEAGADATAVDGMEAATLARRMVARSP